MIVCGYQKFKELLMKLLRKIDVCLVGHHRDDSSFYLDLFPQWGFDEVGQLEDDISASTIRKNILQIQIGKILLAQNYLNLL